MTSGTFQEDRVILLLSDLAAASVVRAVGRTNGILTELYYRLKTTCPKADTFRYATGSFSHGVPR